MTTKNSLHSVIEEGCVNVKNGASNVSVVFLLNTFIMF